MNFRQKVNYWAKVLHLEAWDLHVELVDHKGDMPVADVAGASQYEVSNRHAYVYVRSVASYAAEGQTYTEDDVEETLVHELMHIKMALLEDSGDDLRDKLQHLLVEDLARALVQATKRRD